MHSHRFVVALGLAALTLPLVARQAAAPEKVRIVFAPARHGAYVLSYDKTEEWDYGDRRGKQHVAWTMRDQIATVTKKGKVFVDGEFQSVDYTAHYNVEGADHDDAFRWTADGGAKDAKDAKDDAFERIGKKEIPKGLHLVLDARGAAEHGEC
jgi:hypothetical protein